MCGLVPSDSAEREKLLTLGYPFKCVSFSFLFLTSVSVCSSCSRFSCDAWYTEKLLGAVWLHFFHHSIFITHHLSLNFLHPFGIITQNLRYLLGFKCDTSQDQWIKCFDFGGLRMVAEGLQNKYQIRKRVGVNRPNTLRWLS